MAAIRKPGLHRHLVGLCFVILASLTRCGVCWPRTISQEPVVGFDINLTHGVFLVTVAELISNRLIASEHQ